MILSNTKPLRKRVLLAVGALSVSALACQFYLGGPTPPAPTIEVSSSSAAELESSLTSALQQAQATDGRVVLIVTEKQLTSYVNDALENRPEAPLQEPQVHFRDGALQVHGVAEQGLVRANVLFEIQPRVKEDGTLAFDIAAAEFGPFPMPDSVKDSISSLISEAFAGSIGPYATGMTIESVAISDGEMAITATLR